MLIRSLQPRGYIGIMEKEMESTILYSGHSGIMDNRMETTAVWEEDCAV